MNLKKEIIDKKTKLKYVDEDGNSKVIDSFGTLNIEDIHAIIKKIVYWYRVKFPDQDLIMDDDSTLTVKSNFRKNNSDYMTIEQFNIRLSKSVVNAFQCKYISNYDVNFSELKKNVNFDGKSSYIFINLINNINNQNHFFIKDNKKDCLIVSDDNGKIVSIIGDNPLLDEVRENFETINLEQLLCILKKSQKNSLDFYYLEECVNKRKKDVAIRDKIINIVATELLFNATKEEYGYFRASHFLNDFNTLYNLNLDNSYLDEIIRKHNEYTLKNDNQCNKKNKSLVKSKKSCYG